MAIAASGGRLWAGDEFVLCRISKNCCTLFSIAEGAAFGLKERTESQSAFYGTGTEPRFSRH